MLTPILISIIASIAAFIGGAVALRFRDKLHLILGFSAGAVIGAALFDLIPEAINLGGATYSVSTITTLTAAGFLTYLILDRVFSFHVHNEHERGVDENYADHITEEDHSNHSEEISAKKVTETPQGSLGAASFCLHSLIDGIAIGLAFQASSIIGSIVAIAVVAHRFSDGINTVGVILKHRGESKNAVKWLTAVALSPLVGTVLTFFISVSNSTLAIILAIFAGFFLYIGASDLIPEGHHSHSKILTTIMTLLGAVTLYIIVHVA